ncbi:hypothetical protein [Hymenobacter glacieicola]|uniref:Uncharacterized protein n=1 Tax=Hymenobacter glacieicola TaxID=1562124 RepID=A0ABQ1WXW0_9BACT|nr:hypothetical protein [Hymenobacter glacieicola]GGG50315.1 hypothetical protein GCM10011378_28070 [Hymenobacter glacieicola]
MSLPATHSVYPPLPEELTALLRTIRLHLLALHPTSPYRVARLVRIADQLEYVLSRWPLEGWPQASRQEATMPTKVALLTSITATKASLTSPIAQQELQWRAMHKLLLENTLHFI